MEAKSKMQITPGGAENIVAMSNQLLLLSLSSEILYRIIEYVSFFQRIGTPF
jgi:hypothetical protein